jgi:hypothetical protein
VLTRRGFVGCVAGSLTAVLPLDLCRRIETPKPVLLDLGEHCGLRESLSGYASALAEAPAPSRCALLIVPAAVGLPPSAVGAIVSCLRAGDTVLLESGAGFASPRGYEVHRAMLRDHFGVHVGPAVALWSPPPRSRGMPYVDYTWPCRATVRDFSRVVPVEGPGKIIARVDSMPVSLKRSSGRGTLIFLGSPLGPVLLAGDAEARRWLSQVVAG